MNPASPKNLIREFQAIRKQTETLCKPLNIEDFGIQSMEDVSPPKWHLAHTTWFFEQFILSHQKNYQRFDTTFEYLFNSYYHSIGNPFPRAKRGLLARPCVEKIYQYRTYVDEHLIHCLENANEETCKMITLGLHHEQQHQELLLMDIKHNFSMDPFLPTYKKRSLLKNTIPPSYQFVVVKGDTIKIGYQGDAFCFDNELSAHDYILPAYQIGLRLVTNGEYLTFIEAGGYQQPQWWLADGWDCVIKNKWQHPLYWHEIDKKWHIFTLSGLEELNLHEPITHLSYYEADAYARFRQCRLPTEAEWEHVARDVSMHKANLMEDGYLHPIATEEESISQLYGDVWEWTSSPYIAYPGYKLTAGALGEYNGKFMSNQMVLRGGSCITPRSHIRASYRNFFQPEKRWQFAGLRLACDA